MSVAHLFVGMLTAVVVFAVPVIAMWHFASKMYHEANQQGVVPFLSGIIGTIIGLFVSVGVVGSWLSIVSYAGFPARYYACYFSYGNMQKCKELYSDNSEMAKDFEESLQRGEESLPKTGDSDSPPWLR